MKVLLFAPPFELSAKKMTAYPLGLCYLGAVLERDKHIVKAYNYLWQDWNKVKDEIKEIIIKEKPNIIGVSLMTTNRTNGFELAKLTKEINPNIKVIFGGVHSTIMYEQILNNFPIDFIVLGEGEITFPKLLRAIENKTPYNMIDE